MKMTRIKKPITVVLILSFLVSALFPALAAGASADGDGPARRFIDVAADAWFREYVDFVSERGIMGGDGSPDTFLPDAPTTRAMLAVILHRLEGTPRTLKKSPFADLDEDWYAAGVNWAWESAIVKGTGDTAFTPDGIITRQEMVTMLYRYAGQKSYSLDHRGSAAPFDDGDRVAGWALDAVEWALGAGLIVGRSAKTLAPEGNTSRCEMATILTRFITKFEDPRPAEDPLFAKADALRSSSVCARHGAALHAVFGSPGTLTEEEVGAFITDQLGLDRSFYRFTVTGDGFTAFSEAYSALGNGEGALIPISFEIKNLRTTGGAASVDSFPLYAVRNDFYSVPHTVLCEDAKIADEALASLTDEIGSFLCGDDGCVHVEAGELTGDGLGGALLALFGLDESVYAAEAVGDGLSALKDEFDALSPGDPVPVRDISFTITNKVINAKADATVPVSVMKTDGGAAAAVPCPLAEVRRALELFGRKYVCGEHGCAHIASDRGGDAALADVEAIVAEALDLPPLYGVKVGPFGADSYTVSVSDARGYRHESLSFRTVRSVDPSSPRARFVLCDSDRDAYRLIVHDSYGGETGYGAWNEGQTKSGWLIDTRADDGVRHGQIRDVSTTERSQAIRPINDTFKGVIRHRCSVTIESGFDGAVLDFENDKGVSVCRLGTVGGAWKILSPDGSFVTIYEPDGETRFVFDLVIDLYGGTVRVTVNGVDRGTYPLSASGVNANIADFRFSSTDEDVVTFSMGLCETTVNYSLFDLFSDQYLTADVPDGWTGEDISFSPNDGISGSWDNRKFDGRMSVGGSAERSFEPTEGQVIARFSLLPSVSGADAEYAVLGCGEKLVFVTADDSSFYVNGERAYDYAKNVWYRFYLLCDTETGTVKLKINGIDRGDYFLLKTGVPFDAVRVESRGEPVLFDEFFVYNDVSHGDYVPEPRKPAGGEEYNVGVNTCTMWLNGFHGGWACISPFDDTRPVLGYYDEGNPETADWEIKYLVEHGVDFESFVSFGLEESGPVTLGLGWHLEDGYKLAKYSDMMKYCLNWCSGSPESPGDLESWKTYYVPYLIEHHFKDPRYMVIDNKPLMTFFQFILPGQNPYWTTENRKTALDYLDEQVKALGFDGVLTLEVDWASNADNASEGIDGVYSYNFGKGFALEGPFEEITKKKVLRLREEAAERGLTYVPTVSTGFNSIGWMDPRTPVMTAEEFYDCNKWIRDEFFGLDPDGPSWARNLIILSTWNEYGEGTYIMPCEENQGFGYLDAIRELYTSEGADGSLDLIPTAAQLERINRLYPQDLKLLRAQEYERYENGVDIDRPKTDPGVETVASVDPSGAIIGRDGNITVTGGTVRNDSDKRGAATFRLDCGVDLSLCESVGIVAYIPNGSLCQMKYGSGEHGGFNAILSEIASGRGVCSLFTLDISECGTAGDALEIRLPAGTVIREIRLFANPLVYFGNRLSFSGTDVPMKIFPELSARGDYLFAFDTIFTDLHLFGMFARWDAGNGRMTVNLPGNEFVFTAGSEFYTHNGTRVFLGYAVEMKDGVPMIPLNIIAERAGYRIDFSDMRNAMILKEEA